MTCQFNPDFKGVTSINSESQFMNTLEDTMKVWSDWGMLRLGGWNNVTIDQTNAWNGNNSILRVVRESGYQNGQVWQGNRKDWVWETGVDYQSGMTTYNPIQITGVFVNGTGIESGFSVNYPLGRIIFDTPQPTGATVKASYSYRYVQTHVAHRAQWFQELQYESFRSDNLHFSQTDERGVYEIGANHRVQMPCVVFEAVPISDSSPYEQGNGSAWVRQHILVHVFAESRQERNDLLDIYSRQYDKSIYLLDFAEMADSGAYPLNNSGGLVNAAWSYPNLVVSGFNTNSCRFIRSRVASMKFIHQRLHHGFVDLTAETILPA